jgi:hypothetical protein
MKWAREFIELGKSFKANYIVCIYKAMLNKNLQDEKKYFNCDAINDFLHRMF